MSCDPFAGAKVGKRSGILSRTFAVRYRDCGKFSPIKVDLTWKTITRWIAMMHQEVRAINKWCDVVRFPLPSVKTFRADALSGTFEISEMLLVDWESGVSRPLLKLKSQLSVCHFRIHAASPYSSSPPQFPIEDFPGLSSSVWTQGGELIYTAPIEDRLPRRSACTFGIGVTCWPDR
jgi:hypothetical protein